MDALEYDETQTKLQSRVRAVLLERVHSIARVCYIAPRAPCVLMC